MELTLSQRIDRAVAAVECESLQAIHTYWHAAGIHREEYTDYWSKDWKITWAHHFGQNGNRWTYWQNYVLAQECTAYNRFREVLEKYPDAAKDVIDPRTVKEYSNHFLTSPIIEVAKDGQTAKGIFYTPGSVSGFATTDGKVRGFFLFERYGADFKLEDGKWVYKNLRVCPDIRGEIGGGGFSEAKPFGGMPPMGPNGDTMTREEAMTWAKNAVPDLVGYPYEIPAPLHFDWSKTQTVQKAPPMPMPYDSIDGTFLYSDVAPLERD